ncbi:MAG: tellurite resistance TerB family protein [Rhodospirillaceae bacterium]|jgi:tellurite resistance protein|nr:tellurite resistance TerB family protein [Rhodospirillaceae bacterium]MBT3808678.1 tellurite resistance TerB family protein [Rhodospirillaceae bacterium]MBT3932223.1 tellurite resistance TerB family protein [Rhodospirillaceae bacterium]MBT4773732.1 tellurite resistance TerB family protein [Rhodospirillaceae bacterium]MBT5357612.1 tellurite resistance TerB family protein [Rhodospirillaceae bacterium]
MVEKRAGYATGVRMQQGRGWRVKPGVQKSARYSIAIPTEASTLFDRFRKELQRHRQRPFLEAVAAACALVATADGDVSFSERARLDAVVESLSELSLFDPHEVVDAFDEHVAVLSEDADGGHNKMLKRITSGTGKEGAADLLLRISVAMSLADGRDSADEHKVIDQICAALGLAPTAAAAAFDALAE